MKIAYSSICLFFLIVSPSRAIDFSQSIRPILSDHCFQCHGPDEKERAADLRLDTAEGVEVAFAGGLFDESEAWRRINSSDPDEQMPPPTFPKPLTSKQLESIKQWMNEGSPWSQHWAFEKPMHRALPDVDGVEHPIDKFVVEKLRIEGLQVSPKASRETLIRRLSFDLLGLPPTIDEVEAFVNDQSPLAYSHLVDRLLSSPHFGERMALEWLDGARYADTNGYQNDFKRSMWPWRDWVIKAFNNNIPFDQFVIEQLAGDLLPSPTLQQRVATGFNRNHRTVTEFGSIDEEWLVENVVDRVETTSTVFLGLTMGCARCHDHKYDPISQREFYQFFSFFHNVKEKGVYPETRGNVAPLQPVLPEDQLSRLDKLRNRWVQEEGQFNTLKTELPKHVQAWTEAEFLQNRPLKSVSSQLEIKLSGNAEGKLSDGSRIQPAENSGTISWVEEIFGSVAKFSGLHVLSYGQTIAPDRNNSFAFTFWIKPEKMGSVVDKIDTENLSRGFDIYWKEDGRLEMHLIHSWPEDAIKISTELKDAVPRGKWSHIAISYDGTSKAAGITLLVNGIKVPIKAERDQLKDSFAVDVPIRIGHKSRGRLFFGSLSDLRYFEKVVDEQTVASIVRQGLVRCFSLTADQQREEFEKDRNDLYASFSRSPFAIRLRNAENAIQVTQNEIDEIEADSSSVMVMEELSEPRSTYVLIRGEYDKPDKNQPVTADIPQSLGKITNMEKKDRLALAQWIVSPENPLTSRVRVNRIWQMLFGVGLVKTSENFGVQAEMPSHPELLDWLALNYSESGWDTKQLLKMIVSSSTYQQSSVVTPELMKVDPENRLLARGPRFRLSAEFIRDNALAVSGLLTKKIGGESIKPYQPDKLWDELAGGAGEGKYIQSHGDDLYRRSLYIYRKRTVPHPTTSTFDAPSFEICQVARARTNTPLQALALLNDVTYVEAARKLAERMLVEGGESDQLRLTYGFRLATGRTPNESELETLLENCNRNREMFSENVGAAKTFLSHGESKISVTAPSEQLAAYAAVASVLLNLDETITKE